MRRAREVLGCLADLTRDRPEGARQLGQALVNMGDGLLDRGRVPG